MSAPQLRLPIQSVHFDSEGFPVESGGEYILEWMRRNKINNGGLESWTGASLDWWDDSSMKKIDAGIHGGLYAAQSVDSHSSLDTPFIEVKPGYSYYLQFWHKGASAGTALTYTIYAYNSAQVQIGVGRSASVASATSWGVFQLLVPVSEWWANAQYVKISFGFGNSPLITIDDISFTGYNPLNIELFSGFAALHQDSEETFTFPGYPLVGSVFDGEDDPSQDIESISGHLRIEQDRYPRREMNIKLRLTAKESLRQLRRFHAKTRGLTFTYVDHEGTSHSVRWRGAFSASPMQTNTDIYIVTLPLVLATVTDGA